jgi:hypothetical protein
MDAGDREFLLSYRAIAAFCLVPYWALCDFGAVA